MHPLFYGNTLILQVHGNTVAQDLLIAQATGFCGVGKLGYPLMYLLALSYDLGDDLCPVRCVIRLPNIFVLLAIVDRTW